MSDNSNFVLRWDIANEAATLATKTAESEVFNRGGFEWIIGVQPNDVYPMHADFILTCDNPKGGKWKCEVDVKLVQPFDFAKRISFNDEDRTYNFVNMIGYAVLTNVNLTSQIIEFRVNIISSKCAPVPAAKFSSPNENGNVTLMIEDKKLRVSKEYLAIHSPVFAAMFFGDFVENGREEVELKDVVYESYVKMDTDTLTFPEFVDILHLIYVITAKKITDCSVVHILKLADQFQMERVLELSNEHLMECSSLNVAKKLHLADQYRLVSLRDHCLRSFTSLSEVAQKLMTSSEYANFSGEMKIAICDRIAELSGSVN